MYSAARRRRISSLKLSSVSPPAWIFPINGSVIVPARDTRTTLLVISGRAATETSIVSPGPNG
jgi:hypothetical protein